MTFALFIFITRLVGITVTVLLGLLFLKSHPKSYNARMFAVICTGVIAILILFGSGNFIYAPYRFEIGNGVYLLILFGGLLPWAAMALSHSLFQDKQGLPKWIFPCLLTQIFLDEIEIACVFVTQCGIASETLGQGFYFFALSVVPDIIKLAFAIFALYWALKDWRSDLVESRRHFRWTFVITQGGLLCVLVISYFYTMHFSLALFPIMQTWTTVLATFYGLCFAYFALKFDATLLTKMAPQLELTNNKSTSPVSTPDQITIVEPEEGEKHEEQEKQEADRKSKDALIQKLLDLLENKKVYRETGISIRSLAQRMELPEYRLRRLIHDGLGFRNFNTLLHKFRLQDACAQLRDPNKDHLPILTIALDVGYGSISSFNSAFKEFVQTSPSKFRDASK